MCSCVRVLRKQMILFCSVSVLLIYCEISLTQRNVTLVQWKSLVQDLQAQEEHPRGLSPVRAAQARGSHSRERESARGRDVTGGRRPERVDRGQQ